ncbi:uncharacterized protein BXIN_2637 [Babesia sp. Xinjiang]|uniref:uncharacterized protein n=1 Tax=Babesia sp. Xinjiang TaxID=462227 RepID=UPI000A239684|nr:uncharacterized protein BXIN_2683 [Babesia sp. Xinjiang]XP_028872112.1 uncharacterized protein BXIN_2637 [Babesia sp. Xinjiang]ORM41613.1 hypothetical protein BXIN_2683 [Babesia sp. Xinjiang]ORM41656.1 hypothetical protein BXIN_2637 [Babesia sp. Xinjiang]
MVMSSVYAPTGVVNTNDGLGKILDNVNLISKHVKQCECNDTLMDSGCTSTGAENGMHAKCTVEPELVCGDSMNRSRLIYYHHHLSDSLKGYVSPDYLTSINAGYQSEIQFNTEAAREINIAGCANFCDTATDTPTSDNDTVCFDEFDENSDYFDDIIATEQEFPFVTRECIMGLINRYVNCTPQLETASMRLLLSRDSIDVSTIEPTQVIRYNRSRITRYDGVRDHLENSSVFRGVRQGLSEENTEATPTTPTETAELPKLLVVLDLDETLVHMHDRPNEQFDYLVNIVEPDGCNPERVQFQCASSSIVGFTVHPTMQVSLRPGVLEFFRYLRAHCSSFAVALFTAGTRHYADAILHAIDPLGHVIPRSARFYRDSCVLTSTPSSISHLRASCLGIGSRNRDDTVPQVFLKKDLTVLGWPLSRVVFFDNSLLSFMANPDNGVWVRPWQGAQPYIEGGHVKVVATSRRGFSGLSNVGGQDGLYEFQQIVHLLEELKNVADVRQVLRHKFTIHEIIDAVKGRRGGQATLEGLLLT